MIKTHLSKIIFESLIEVNKNLLGNDTSCKNCSEKSIIKRNFIS